MTTEASVIGRDSRDVEIPLTTPIAAPGGLAVPFAFESALTVRGQQLLIDFGPTPAQQLSVQRLYVQIPLLLTETERETTTSENTEERECASGEEAEILSKQYIVSELLSDIPAGYEQHAETVTKAIVSSNFLGTKMGQVYRLTSTRSLLPITPTVTIALCGPEGTIWNEDFQIPVHIVGGNPGSFVSVGNIATYTDLTNPLILTPALGQYGFAFTIFIPTSLKSNPRLGATYANNTLTETPGNVTLFYDIQQTTLGK